MRDDLPPILRGLALAALLIAAVAGAPRAQAGTRCDTQTVSAEKVAAA
ncbi:MAG: hypothetical protein HOQ32_15370, partial [Lysobacter sp.]|nr:hypothetical protein [Lysobacter sp.]